MQTILFLHGWGGNADSFAPVSQYFARATDINGEPYQVLAPSLPCPPTKVYTLEDYADDVDRYLQEHQVARCIVVAHSFGARLVAILNARHPKLFTKIVITSGAGLPPRWRLSVWLKIRWCKLCRRLGWRAPKGSADYRHLDDRGKRTFQNVIQRNLTFEVKQITAPVLLIWGTRDRATPMEHCRRFQRLLPQAQTIIYRHCGHFAYLEQPARFIRDVTHFIDGEWNA
ncbi:MAG: alpha/beta hydrolase [Clostridia bacterium]|nr:alpha/beta hydrolase [Clostridia bacterium]